jgi:hypothetical protein
MGMKTKQAKKAKSAFPREKERDKVDGVDINVQGI